VKLLLILRTIAVIVAVASLLLSLITADAVHDRLRRLAKLAAFGVLGAQLAAELDRVLGKRAPWTKLLVPVVGITIAIRTFNGAALPFGTIALLGAVDLVLMAFAIVVVVRVVRREPQTYPEDALERELNRFTPGPVSRYIAMEIVLIASAVRYLCGGFRRPLPPGFSYVRRWASMPLFIAMPVLIVPEMIAFDFVLWNAGWWRLVSDVLHAYAMLWAIGVAATARIRPHRCDAERVRLRFGCLRRLDLKRANIATARVHGTVAGDFKRTLRRAGDAVTLMLDGVPTVELTLHEPVVVRSISGRMRPVRRVFVAADDPAAFAAALAA
jgi:membrane protein YdbS with pleckstrin-like domain